jgi:purine nucleosidase
MPRKILIDCDPGIDDAVALAIAMFHTDLEIVAITATEGNVSAEQSNRNVQAIIEQLDPPRYPRIGVATPLDQAPSHDARLIHGDDGLANTCFSVSLLHHQHASEKVICDVVRSAPDEITVLALGPLTNIARAMKRDPHTAGMIGRIIMMGGSVDGIGNVTPAAEFNCYYDADAAKTVFRSPTTKTLVPLDVTQQVVFSLDFVNQLPVDASRAGRLLHRIVPHLFRTYRQQLGLERIHLHDVVALMVALHPELFEAQEMAGDVETQGDLTMGTTVFDRRANRSWRCNMEVATAVDVAAVIDGILRGLASAGDQTRS